MCFLGVLQCIVLVSKSCIVNLNVGHTSTSTVLVFHLLQGQDMAEIPILITTVLISCRIYLVITNVICLFCL